MKSLTLQTRILNSMKKTLMILGIILLILALPFSSMVVETMTAQTDPIKEVREGDVIFQTSQSQQSELKSF